jgi:hypothetical protein
MKSCVGYVAKIFIKHIHINGLNCSDLAVAADLDALRESLIKG